MSTLHARIVRLSVVSGLAVGLGALTAAPAFASDQPPAPYETASPGEDDATPDGIGRGSGINSVGTSGEDDAPAEDETPQWYM